MSGLLVPPAARRRLLSLAREAISGEIDGRTVQAPADVAGELTRKAAAFVTLRGADLRLRGCVGYTEARQTLWRTVADAAVGAAFHDGRFPAVKREELAGLSIQISVLSPLFAIRPDEVVVGVHGLVVELGGRRGLLLPQVASEQGWDREQFLDSTSRKAGLSAGSWREPGAQVLAFTAEYFGDDETDPSPA